MNMRPHLRTWIISALIVTGFLMSGWLLIGRDQKKSGKKQMASIDGSVITEAQVRSEAADELESLDLEMMKSKATFALNEHQILESAVDQLLEDKILDAEAAKRGISRDELLAKEVEENSQPTKEEINAFYETNKQRINRPKEEALPQITQYLKNQREGAARRALIKKLEKEHKVIRSFEPLRFDVESKISPSLGPKSAPVVLVVFSDFQCPYCRGLSTTLKQVLKQYGDKVRLVYRQFPLTSIHPFAQGAAEASLCAGAQGHFWEMHDLLFQDQKSLDIKDLKSKAEKLSLDTTAFNACIDTNRFASQVREDLHAAAGAGADGAPALYINGRYLNGNRPFDQIAAIIDDELQRKK